MTRTVQDHDLLLWEVYASSGDAGAPDGAKIMFQCLTDPSRRARFLPRDVARSAAGQEVATMPDEALVALLRAAEEVR